MHRIGKRRVNKSKPIIAHFVCREDRGTSEEQVGVTADYTKAIQVERKKADKGDVQGQR